MLLPESLNELIESFEKLPGIGRKTAERLGFSILGFSDEDVDCFSKSLLNVKKCVKPCNICGTLTESDICSICNDKSRVYNTILVVENSKDVFLFEKISNFNGFYHVLGGLISPLDDIGPDDLSISKLLDRVKEHNVKEVVLAIKTGIEADTTALYIKRILEKDNIVVSRIANGVPMGADMEYIDSLTLETALTNRIQVF